MIAILAKAAMDAGKELKSSSFSAFEIIEAHAKKNGVPFLLVLNQFHKLFPGRISWEGLTSEEKKEVERLLKDARENADDYRWKEFLKTMDEINFDQFVFLP